MGDRKSHTMNTASPRVSVIVPCFNSARFLPDALQSVIAQTYGNWECIIVNDGSTDDTENVALVWCQADKRFKYVKKPNGGLADARNYGIEHCTGEFVLPLDSDDKIGEKYIEKAVKAFIDDADLCLVYSRARLFGARDEVWALPDYDYKLLLVQPHIFCSALFRKLDYDEAGGYDLNMRHGWEDWEFWINLVGTTAGSVRRLDYVGFYYRQHLNSMMHTLRDSATFYEKRQQTREYVYQKHKEKYHAAFGSYMSVLHELVRLERKNREFENLRETLLYRFYRRVKRVLLRAQRRVASLVGLARA